MKLTIKNFRSIKDQEVELAPITVVYGPNGAGKSSLLYAPLTMKNIILNPNQEAYGFFNYNFVNLGRFESVIFDHKKNKHMEFGLSLELDTFVLAYNITIGEKGGSFNLTVSKTNESAVTQLKLDATFPYAGDGSVERVIYFNDAASSVQWNGIVVTRNTKPLNKYVESLDWNKVTNQPTTKKRVLININLNAPIETLRKFTMIPLKRGFTKPYYSPQPPATAVDSEVELANVLNSDKYLISKISHYLELMLGREFRVNTSFAPGTALFSLDTTDKNTGIVSELVNDGFGVNQIVYFLAKCLYHDAEWVCVEEPEIHLHPSGIRDLARVLVKIVHDEGKKFIISTHSESFLAALLTQVVEGLLKPEG
jgi:hypothetical protein